MNPSFHAFKTWSALALLAAGAAATCGCGAASSGQADSRPQILMVVPAENPSSAYVEVTGLAKRDLDGLRDRVMTEAEWSTLLRVTVHTDEPGAGGGEESPAMLGAFSIQSNALRFTPRFPFDAGRRYEVILDPARLPSRAAEGSDDVPVVTVLARPKAARAPSTRVEHLYPTTDRVPENQLRLYVQFSAPMGRGSGLEYIHLIDQDGREVIDPFLPLDIEFWNSDRTRYTFFFDPGRVKKGITPREELGPSLVAGRRYTVAIDQAWLDAEGMPLTEPFRRQITVGPPDEKPLDPSLWRISTPAAGTRDPLVVIFDKPLDHGLLSRAVGVARGKGEWVDGRVQIEPSETRWAFTPTAPWSSGDYNLVALSILEDLAGNQIGRAFEVDRFEEVDRSAEPEETRIPFRVTVH